EGDAARDGGDEGADVVGSEKSRVGEAGGVEEEGAGGDGYDPGGEAVEAVDEVDGVRQDDDPYDGHEETEIRREDDEVGERDAEVEHRHPGQAEGARGQHLARDLGGRRDLAQVVEE